MLWNGSLIAKHTVHSYSKWGARVVVKLTETNELSQITQNDDSNIDKTLK